MIVALLLLAQGQFVPPSPPPNMFVGNWSIVKAERNFAEAIAFRKKNTVGITDPLLKKFMGKVRKGVHAKWETLASETGARYATEAWFQNGWSRWQEKGAEPVVTDGV